MIRYAVFIALPSTIYISANESVTLPITPQELSDSHARKYETVNINTVGDVNMPGTMTNNDIKVSCFFPKRNYPFANKKKEPYDYVEWFKKLIDSKAVVRYIVPDTSINRLVRVSQIDYSERDGFNDVYYTITLKPYTNITGERYSEDLMNGDAPVSYICKKYDTWQSVSRKHYGSDTYWYELKEYNHRGIMCFEGDEILLPPKKVLDNIRYPGGGAS